jgi:hypothetical protein
MINEIDYRTTTPRTFFVKENNINFGYFLNDDDAQLQLSFPDKRGEFVSYTEISSLNKNEVTEHLIRISKAYVFAHERHEELLEKDASRDQLENQFKLIKLIRNALKFLAKYEEEYTEMKEEYQNP